MMCSTLAVIVILRLGCSSSATLRCYAAYSSSSSITSQRIAFEANCEIAHSSTCFTQQQYIH
eukprot:7005-Heterococcus_DN1.PRE.1